MNPLRKLCLSSVLAGVALLGSSHAGTYVNDFTSSDATDWTFVGGTRPNQQPYPAIEGGHLALVYAEGGQSGTAFLKDLDNATAIESFNMDFKIRIGGGSSTPADGISLFFGGVEGLGAFGEEGPLGIPGLTIAFDIYDNGNLEAPAIDIKVNGEVIAHKPYDIFGIVSDTFAPVSIRLKRNGTLTMTYKGQPVVTDLWLPGYAPTAGDRFAWGARTGDLNANQWIDDLNISTVLATPVGPSITTHPTAQAANERGSVTFSVVADGSAPLSFQWYAGEDLIAGANAPSYTIDPVTVAAGGINYSVEVANAISSARSNPAMLTVTADATRPTVVSAVGSAGLNTVLVTFSEPITEATLTSQSGYSISGGVAISEVTMVSPTQVRLTTSAQTPGTEYTITFTGQTDTAATPNMIAAGTTTTFDAFVLSRGFLRMEYWGNIGGNSPSDLINNARYQSGVPDQLLFIPAFNTRTVFPDDSHEAYGARFTGFIIPSESGLYRFFISSDDGSALYLAADGNPASLALIASEPSCCNAFSEPGAHSRTSEPIQLEAGVQYPVEAFLKEGVGGDYLMVAWRKEGDTTAAANLQPIPGSFLAAYADPSLATLAFTTQPTSREAAANTTTTFQASATGSPAPLTYQWQRKAPGAADFVDISGATGATYTTPVLNQANDNGAVYRVIARVPGATLTSSEATLTVIIDSIAPRLLTARAGENQRTVTLTFSESLDPVTGGAAANYSIPGLTVNSVSINGTQVTLNTVAQTAGTTYTLTINGVRDSAGNLIDAAARSLPFTAFAIQPGVVRYDAYYGLTGTAVANLTSSPKYPNAPDFTMLLANTAAPSAFADNYGARVSGFFVPDVEGDYRFFITSDDSSALWVSTSDSPADLPVNPTAYEPGCCRAFAEPAEDNTRTSAALHLMAGQKYYFVYLIKEGGGGDNGTIAWRNELDGTEAAALTAIPGKNLAAALEPAVLQRFVLSGGTAPGTGVEGAPGFEGRVYQIDQTGGITAGLNIARAEQELAGIIGPNVATETGVFAIADVLNFNQDFATAEIGSFTSGSATPRPDAAIPGIPGTGTVGHNTDAFAAEFTTYVEFPAAGVYYMGVNSDDGFKVTNAENPPANNGALIVTSPASIARAYHTLVPGADGSAFPPQSAPITGRLVYATPPEGCSALSNAAEIAGNIALIDRGVCTFAVKAQAAKDAGAIAVIIVNSRDPGSADGPLPSNMGGTFMDFPAFMISKPDGAIIKTAVGQTITISITPDTTPALGQFASAGRGSTDTLFPVIVPAAGVYPLRTVWYEGDGGANFEWFSVTAEGEEILLNDRANPNALKAYATRTGGGATPTISISKSQTGVTITFTGRLYEATSVDGPFQLVNGATGSITVPTTGTTKFYVAGP